MSCSCTVSLTCVTRVLRMDSRDTSNDVNQHDEQTQTFYNYVAPKEIP